MCSSSNAIYCSSNVLRCTHFSLFNMPANGVCLTFKQWLLRIEAVWRCLRGRRRCSATAQLNLFQGEWFGFLTFVKVLAFLGFSLRSQNYVCAAFPGNTGSCGGARELTAAWRTRGPVAPSNRRVPARRSADGPPAGEAAARTWRPRSTPGRRAAARCC